MGEGAYYEDLNRRMAQFELTLLDWAENHKGARQYVAFANKCWPAFPSQFGFEPCYVNSRLAGRGIPVACEVDIYGALSEYIGLCVTDDAVTLLDINNTVPAYIYDEDIKGKYDYKLSDTFMGFHCGNTPECKLCASRAVKYQLIQHRLLEPEGSEPDFTRGTLEGGHRRQRHHLLPPPVRQRGRPARLCGPGRGARRAHPQLRRHRRVRHPRNGPLLPPRAGGQALPAPRAVAFRHCGRGDVEVFKFLGVKDIAYNRPASRPYPTENPFA